MIPKAGSSAIATALLFAQQPDYTIRSVSGDPEKVEASRNRAGRQAAIDKTETPVNPIIGLRDPVERFRSACAQEGKTAEEALTKIEAGDFSGHFKPQVDWLVADSRLYKFPEHIDDIAQALGLDEIQSVNDSATNNGPKPDLTADELARVQAIYADDIALYESITEAGQEWIKPPTPATDEMKAAKLAELEQARYEDEVNGFALSAPSTPFDGAPIRTDREYSQLAITQAYLKAKQDPAYQVDNWHMPDGSYVSIPNAILILIGDQMDAHIQGTRTKHAGLEAQTQAATTQAELEAIVY